MSLRLIFNLFVRLENVAYVLYESYLVAALEWWTL